MNARAINTHGILAHRRNRTRREIFARVERSQDSGPDRNYRTVGGKQWRFDRSGVLRRADFERERHQSEAEFDQYERLVLFSAGYGL